MSDIDVLARRDVLAVPLLAGITALSPGLAAAQGAAGADAPPVRRIVAANNAKGKSRFVSDERIMGALWSTTPDLPLGALAPDEPKEPLPGTATLVAGPKGSTSTGVFPIRPWPIMRPMFEAGRVPGHDAAGFHRTRTIDFVQVLDDGLSMLLDEGRVELQRGDLVIQRNTLHSWQNHTDKTIRILAVLIAI